MLCLWLTRRETISADMQRIRAGPGQKLTAANGYHSGRHFLANGAARRTVRNLSRFSSNRGNVYGEERTRDMRPTRRGVARRGISSRRGKAACFLPAMIGQEEASKRAECLANPTAGNPTRMMIYPLVSCGRSLKIVPRVKRCNRLPLL